MSEYTFRAKTTKKEDPKQAFNEVWIEGDLIHSDGKTYIHPTCNLVTVEGELGKIIIMHEVDPDTVCKYTGKCDMNIKRIWENDIVETEGIRGIVKFGEYMKHNIQIGFFIDFIDKTKTRYIRQDYVFWLERGIKVIGNTFDDPELLESEAQDDES